MGVGKTSTSRELQNLLPRCVFLDGDWCWDMKPFTVTDETKAMVEDNIKHTLNNFIKCSEFQNIIFCWVMHQQYIIDNLISGLDLGNARLCKVSLICSEQALIERISVDIRKGKRSEDVIERSIPRLKNYEQMDTFKIDTSNIDVKQAAQQIADYIRNIGG
jgi:hypothetical protein